MVKFNREYSLAVQAIDGEIVPFALPYSIEFDVRREAMGQANHASIKIYNLAPATRNRLRKDSTDIDIFRRVYLKVGYDKSQSTIFDGTMSRCWSYRDGVNFITEIEAYDGGFAYLNKELTLNYRAGTTYQELAEDAFKQLSNVGVSKGAIGNFTSEMKRAGSFSDKAVVVLKKLFGNNFFIDNGRLSFLQDFETLPGSPTVINSQSGLLGTPLLEGGLVTCELILEPRFVIGQYVELDSTAFFSGGSDLGDQFKHANNINNFNASYKIVGISHAGTISPRVAGSAKTHISLAKLGSTVEESLRGIL